MSLYQGSDLGAPEIAALLAEARARTRALVAPLAEDELSAQHSPLMSPIVWDLGHIGHFEEVWLLENLATGGSGSEGLRGVYNPFENPRSSRGELQLPTRAECFQYQDAVRGAVLAHLDAGRGNGGSQLQADGFVYRMVAQHEYQHNETILQTLQLMKGRPYPAPRAVQVPDPPSGNPGDSSMVRFPGGRVGLGTDDRSAAWDNERPRHSVDLGPFWIDATPVTNGAYLRFMAEGGYGRREYWSDAGWRWLEEAGVEAPMHWTREGGTWSERVMDRERPVDATRPVCHVCFHEAEAYARWADKRLPTEAEWEAAACWSVEEVRQLRYPWGDADPTAVHANLDVLAFDTAPVWAYPLNVSPTGCYGMIGDVWEWTSSDFVAYPRYEAFPYKEYSEVFFGDEYKVLRGGSWATRPGAVRGTFRNWDYPIRRQIFSGFRCARDG
jgi:iron(II)-dependent oxidoreductase